MDRLTPPLFGLTLNQPWPLCMQQLGKDVENRTWHPRAWGGEVGMLLAIHGGQLPRKLDGKSMQAHDFRQALDWVAQDIVNAGHLPPTLSRMQLRALCIKQGRGMTFHLEACVLTGIVAVCRVSAVTRNDPSPWAVPGYYHWVLSDITPVEPIPYVGKRGLWPVEDAIGSRLRAALHQNARTRNAS